MCDSSVDIVNRNSVGYLERCLRSRFRKHRVISFETIVLDNASFAGSAVLITNSSPRIRYVQREEDCVFSAAPTSGLTMASGRHVLFLDRDIEFVAPILPPLVTFLDEHASFRDSDRGLGPDDVERS